MKQSLRGGIESHHTIDGVAVGQPEPAKANAPQGVAAENGETRGVLLEVLEQRAEARLLQGEGIHAREDRRLAELIKMVLALKNGKSRVDRPVKQVGLRKPEGI